jgi:hypothetical protein
MLSQIFLDQAEQNSLNPTLKESQDFLEQKSGFNRYDSQHRNNKGSETGVTKRCRLSWLTNSALVYEPKCGGRGELRGSQPMSTVVHRSPK